jgi:hypothetical protein
MLTLGKYTAETQQIGPMIWDQASRLKGGVLQMPLVSNAIKTILYDLRIIYLPNSYQLRSAQTRQSA